MKVKLKACSNNFNV